MHYSLFAPLLAIVLLSTSARAEPALFSPEDVFSLSYASDPQVSPDGSFIVYSHNFMDIMEDKRRSNLWRIDSNGENARPLTSGAVNDRGARIAPDSSRVAYLSRDENGSQIFVRWLADGASMQLTRLPQAPSNLVWSPDGQWLAFSMRVPAAAPTMGELPEKPEAANWAEPPRVVQRISFRRDGSGMLPQGFDHVFVVAAGGGAVRQLSHGDFPQGGSISWAADSRSLYFVGNRQPDYALDSQNSEIYHIGIEGGEIRAITAKPGPDRSVRVAPDGSKLAWLGYEDRRLSNQLTRLYVMPTDGDQPRDLLSGFERSVSSAEWASDGKGIYISYDDTGITKLAYVNLRGKWADISSQLSGLSLSRPYSGAQFAVGGRNTYAFTQGTATSPANIASGRGTGKATRLTDLNANLLPHRQLAEVEEIWLKSSFDELDIQAWIARPPGFDPSKKYPLLLEIHGGPHTTYGPHFAAEVQLYAAAGYVVLYVNPRGSTSYGEDFANTIHHNYPSEDYDDLMSAVDTVIEKGYIDSDQLYVTGGSGGGVLTAWIVGTTQRFRAAVVAKPVINWISFSLSADLPAFFTQYWFPKMPWEDPMGYWKRSPLSRVGNVTTPTMLISGEQDWRTPLWESEQYYQALKLRGIDTALVRIPGASHSIAARPSQLIAKVAAILEWFDRHSGKEKEKGEGKDTDAEG